MTPRPMNRYLGIAIDHGTTFDRWLSIWGADPESREATKYGILGVCLDAGISGLVIGFDLHATQGLVLDSARAAGAETWLGLPAKVIEGEYDEARSTNTYFPVAPSLLMAKNMGAVGVKVSMSLARHARWADVMRWLTPSAKLAQRLGLSIIVEPYFSVNDSVEDRVGFLAAAERLACIRFAKLDVHEPHVWSHQYGRGFSPWLARSEGLEFPAFCRGVEQSLTSGCVGTMVGAAVWGIRERPVLGDRFTDELNRRLALLRNLIKPAEAMKTEKATEKS